MVIPNMLLGKRYFMGVAANSCLQSFNLRHPWPIHPFLMNSYVVKATGFGRNEK